MREKYSEYLPPLKIELSLREKLNKLVMKGKRGGRGVRGGLSEFIREAIRKAIKEQFGGRDD